MPPGLSGDRRSPGAKPAFRPFRTSASVPPPTLSAVPRSVSNPEARTDSEVDLLVQFFPGAKTYDRFLALSDLLEVHLGHTVDLVTVEALSPFLGPHILAEAEDVLRAA